MSVGRFLGRLLVSVGHVLTLEEAETTLSTATDGRRRRAPLADAATSLSTDDGVVLVSAVAATATSAPPPAPAILAPVAGTSPGLTPPHPFPSAEMAGGDQPRFRRLRPMSEVPRTASGVAAGGGAGGAAAPARPATPSTLTDTPTSDTPKSVAPVAAVSVAAKAAEMTNSGSGPDAVVTTGMPPAGGPTGTGGGSRSAAEADRAADTGCAVAGDVPRKVGIGLPATVAEPTARSKNRGLSSGIEKLYVPRPLLCFVLQWAGPASRGSSWSFPIHVRRAPVCTLWRAQAY